MRHPRFHRSLYEEHLEEVSILYERRLGLLDDPTASPDDVGELEARLDAHLDALVVGGEAALVLCSERATTDAGTLFGAVGVFARQRRPELLQSTLAQLEELELDDDDDALDVEASTQLPTFAVALSDALRFEAPADWLSLFERLLLEAPPVVAAAVARAVGYRRLPLGPQLVSALESATTPYYVIALLWALGRVREPMAKALLYNHAQATDADTVGTACLALLRLGDPSVLDYLVQLTPSNRRAPLLLAISGEPSLTSFVHSRLAQFDATPEEILGAALCGDLGVVPWLLEYLDRGRHADVVAEALYLLTGAALFESVEARVKSIDVFTEDDPRDIVQVDRLAQNSARWRAWWETHGPRLDRRVRHRLGRPASPAVIAEALQHFVLRRSVRELIADELDLRVGPELAVDVDIPLGWQRAAIARLRAPELTPHSRPTT